MWYHRREKKIIQTSVQVNKTLKMIRSGERTNDDYIQCVLVVREVFCLFSYESIGSFGTP